MKTITTIRIPNKINVIGYEFDVKLVNTLKCYNSKYDAMGMTDFDNSIIYILRKKRKDYDMLQTLMHEIIEIAKTLCHIPRDNNIAKEDRDIDLLAHVISFTIANNRIIN